MIVIVIYSCGNNDSDLRSLTEQENEELFQKNNQLILRLQKQNEILKSKQDSLNSNIDDLREKILTLTEKSSQRKIEESGMYQEELDKELTEELKIIFGIE